MIPVLFVLKRKFAFGLHDGTHLLLVRYLNEFKLSLGRAKLPEGFKVIASGEECMEILGDLRAPLFHAMASDMAQGVEDKLMTFPAYAKKQAAIRKQGLIHGTR